MPEYHDKYSTKFNESVDAIVYTDKDESILGKALNVVLEKPFKDAIKVENQEKYRGQTIFRKQVCAKEHRLIYCVFGSKKEVHFICLLPKSNKRLYEKIKPYLV